jgi:hypothetical protein
MCETNLKFQKISGKKLIIILLGRHSLGNGGCPGTSPFFSQKSVPSTAPGTSWGVRGGCEGYPPVGTRYLQKVRTNDLYHGTLWLFYQIMRRNYRTDPSFKTPKSWMKNLEIISLWYTILNSEIASLNCLLKDSLQCESYKFHIPIRGYQI